ncbi:MAG: 1-acyl-sn-glycerol-3-phosphate acyltransferase [Clostridia bacterium]|nr:1-acyl-sn-glycerol-3-phosphate acyltransferase [Clostridia bacterium]
MSGKTKPSAELTKEEKEAAARRENAAVRKHYGRTLRAILWLIRLFWRVKVRGGENIPESGAFLVCSNHISIFDIPVLSGAMPEKNLRYMAKKELFRTRLGRRFFGSFGAYPVDRKNGDVGAIKTAISLLREGETLAIFPQGHRYPGVDPRETEVRGGAMLIARRTGAPLIPVYLKTKKNRCRIFRPVEVYIGRPCDAAALTEAAGGDVTEAMKGLFDRICNMGETGVWN